MKVNRQHINDLCTDIYEAISYAEGEPEEVAIAVDNALKLARRLVRRLETIKTNAEVRSEAS